MARTDAKRAYVTLLTNSAYLAGLLVLHDSMKCVETKYPLVVLYPPSFPQVHLDLLRSLGIKSRKIELLEPKETLIIAERFRDTWSKLQAFALTEFERVVLLDCDMTVFSNMDELLDDEKLLPADDWIACSHSCTCNPLNQSFYLPDCTPANCPFTYAQENDGKPPASSTFNSKRTYGLLNSGLVVLAPSQKLYSRIVDYLHNSPTVAKMALPDQDLLGEVFLGKWEPLSWRYNAIKTLRWVHPKLWNDSEGNEGRERTDMLKVLHYIVEKPWSQLLPTDSRDAETHRWWWADWREMIARWKEDEKLSGFVEEVEKLVVEGGQE